MKKILVPCDFSEAAVQAFRFACDFASLNKSEVFLLNVVELPALHRSLLVPVEAYEESFLKELKKRAKMNFEKIVVKWGAKLKTHLFVEHGSVVTTINKFVSKKRIDLVVMGTHGMSGFREYAIGSNTEKIVRSSKKPVIAVKKATKVSSLKNIVFPTNLDLGQPGLISSVKLLQHFLKAKLHILYVNTPANFSEDMLIEKRLNEFVKQNQFKNYTLNIHNGTSEESGITNFSLRFRNKIIAMSTHGRKGLSHLLIGSIAEDVVHDIDCPVWTLSSR